MSSSTVALVSLLSAFAGPASCGTKSVLPSACCAHAAEGVAAIAVARIAKTSFIACLS